MDRDQEVQLRDAFEGEMSMRGLSYGLRNARGFYIASHVEQCWQFYREGYMRACREKQPKEQS